MKKITEITSEREFISKLRTYYRKGRRKSYQRNEISFLGLMEYTGCATREFEYQSDKYFSVGIRAYDWQHGNSLLSALIDKWENEIEAEKRKKQPTQATEAPQISTETAETVNVSAEGEKEAERAENKPTATEVVQMVKTELAKNKAMHTAWHLEFPDGTVCDVRHKCAVAGCDFYEYTETRNGEEAFKDYKATERDIMLYIYQRLDLDVIEPPQSPETPQTVDCATDTPKSRETARKPQNRGIGSTQHHQHSALGTNGYAMLDDASATMEAMNVRYDTLRDTLRSVTHVPRECSTVDAAHW